MGTKHALLLSDHQLLLVKTNSTPKAVTYLASWRKALPAGCMLNGTIHDANALAVALAELRQEAGNAASRVELVLDSGQMMSKMLSLPLALKPKELGGVVQAELGELDSSDRDLVFDFTELAPTDQRQLLCFGVERSILEQVQKLCQEAGFRLTRITTSLSGCASMVQFLPSLADLSFVLCVLNGSTVTTYLFGDGRYLMNSRSRLITPRGTPAVLGEMLGYVSSMIQFSQSNKTAEPARTVYFCGLAPEEEPGCRIVADTFNITAQPLPDFEQVLYKDGCDVHLSECFPLTGCMLNTKRKTTNLLPLIQQKEAQSLQKSSTQLPWAVPIVLGGVVMVASGVLLLMNMQLNNQIQVAREFTQNPENISLSQKAESARTATTHYLAAEAEALRAAKLLETSPQITASILQRALESCGPNTTLKQYSFEQDKRTIVYDFITSDYHGIPLLVARFRSMTEYESVSYTGYSEDTETGGYKFQIVCTLSEKDTEVE